MLEEFDLVCIGSGPAGQRAAVQAAKLGKRVAIIEKLDFVGGYCVESGTIPSKTFREAVQRVNRGRGLESTQSRRLGRVMQEKPTMSELVGHVGRVIEREIAIVHDALQRNGIDVICGSARFAGPKELIIESRYGERRLRGENILIAVGTETVQTAWRIARRESRHYLRRDPFAREAASLHGCGRRGGDRARVRLDVRSSRRIGDRY